MAVGIVSVEHIRGHPFPVSHKIRRHGTRHEAHRHHYGHGAGCRRAGPDRHIPAGDKEIPHKARQRDESERAYQQPAEQAVS